MRVRILHHTEYRYSAPVTFSPHRIFVRPRESQAVRVESMSLAISPTPVIRWQRDPWDNAVAVAFWELDEAESMDVRVELDVRTTERNPFDFILEDRAMRYPPRYSAVERDVLVPYRTRLPALEGGPVLPWVSANVELRADSSMDTLLALNQAVGEKLTYERRDEEGVFTPRETLMRGGGSCRDLAWLFITACREMEIAARFVSGYLCNPEAQGAEGAMHAWAEVFLPGAGWRGFDPTNGVLSNHTAIPVAISHEPLSISPVQGKIYSDTGADAKLAVSLDVEVLEDGGEGEHS